MCTGIATRSSTPIPSEFLMVLPTLCPRAQGLRPPRVSVVVIPCYARARARVPLQFVMLLFSSGYARARARVPHTVADRYGIPVPAMTCHEEKTVKRCSRGSWARPRLRNLDCVPSCGLLTL